MCGEPRTEDAQKSISHTVFNCGLEEGGEGERNEEGEETLFIIRRKAEGETETAQTVAAGTGERRTAIPTVGSGARMVLASIRTRRRCGHTAG